MQYFDPLFVKPTSESKGTEVASQSSFSVESANVCPKCNSATVPSKLLSGEEVMFCTNCRVSLAIPE